MILNFKPSLAKWSTQKVSQICLRILKEKKTKKLSILQMAIFFIEVTEILIPPVYLILVSTDIPGQFIFNY